MKQAIESLIPHQEPFRFADYVVEANAEQIVAVQVFNETDAALHGSFKNSTNSFIPGTILLESMAQCGGAGIKYLELASGLFGLVSIENATFLKGALFNKEIKYVIKNIRVSDKLIKQSGVGYIDGEPVVEATWLCVRIE